MKLRHFPLHVLAALTLCALTPLSAQSDPILKRIYDISALGPQFSEEHVDFMLLPYTRDHHHDLAEDLQLMDVLESLVHEVVAPEEMQFEGRSFDRLDDRRLLLSAPAAVHTRMAELLTALGRGFHRELKLELSVTPLNAKSVEPESSWGARSDVTLQVGQSHRLRSEFAHHVVRGWETEIAQASAHAEPVTAELFTGLNSLLLAQDLGDGSFRVRHMGRLGELLDIESKSVPVNASVFLESGPAQLLSSENIDAPTLAWASFSSTHDLRPGESSSEVLSVRTAEGVVGWQVSLRLVEVDAPVSARFDDMSVRVMEASALLSGPPSRHVTDDASLPARDIVWLSREQSNQVRWTDDSTHLHARLLGASYPPESLDAMLSPLWESGGSVWVMENWILAAGKDQQLDALQASLRRLSASKGSLSLEIGLDEGSSSGERAAATLDLAEGHPAIALVGAASSYVTIYGVDVASGARATSAGAADLFEGILIQAESLAGRAQIRVDLGRLLKVDSFASRGVFSRNAIEQPVMLNASVEGSVLADGERHVIGSVSPPDHTASVRVWARLTQN